MFKRIGVEADCLPYGLMKLSTPVAQLTSRPRRRIVNNVIAHVMRRARLAKFVTEMRRYDLIVVVMNLPNAFYRQALANIETLRKFTRVPIVNYDLHYLATQGWWARRIRSGDDARGIPPNGFLLERYDWYLMASVASEYPMPREPQPYSLIGLDLDDGSLYPGQQGRFVALIDFERPAYLHERMIQIQALEEARIPYTVLNGHYPQSAIRGIYRRSSLYFPAHNESFGFPIAELEACGAYVFLPWPRWAPAHQMKPNIHIQGGGQLTDNFVVYDNDKERLVAELHRIKASYDANVVRKRFIDSQRHLYHGDTDELQLFVQKVQQGFIHGTLHREHERLNAGICDRLS